MLSELSGIIREAVFIAFVAITAYGAILAVTLRRVFYNALGLVLSLFGLAGIYLFLEAPYLAALQLIVYIGAIAILMLFTVMLTDPRQAQAMPGVARLAGAALAGILWFGLLAVIYLGAPVTTSAPASAGIRELGLLLLGDSVLAFELVSVALLVAMTGAILLAQKPEAKS